MPIPEIFYNKILQFGAFLWAFISGFIVRRVCAALPIVLFCVGGFHTPGFPRYILFWAPDSINTLWLSLSLPQVRKINSQVETFTNICNNNNNNNNERISLNVT